MTSAHSSKGSPQNRSAGNTFTALTLDRASRRRRNAAWVAERLEAASTRLLPVWRSQVLVTYDPATHPVWLSPEEAGEELRRAESVILLGEGSQHTYFALGLRPGDESAPNGPAPDSIPTKGGAFQRLRAVAPLLDGASAALLAYAKAMVHYHLQHRFCGICGSPTVSKEGGYLRACTNAECGHHDFPRTDPAIIVLVSSGERCLLGRQPTWPENLYSIIAGFVEPGESLESAVAREVREETGVRVGRVRYHSSQPWPFPRSLMIGFTATAKSTAIRLNDGELADARWVSREDIARELKQGTLQLPSSISISRRLIETWFDAEGSLRLTHLLGSE
jgi:NAD+ diphosphatase